MKESLINLDKSVIFRETFNSRSDLNLNFIAITDVTFNNSISTFNGTTSKIQYAILNLGLKHSIRLKFKLTEIPSSSHIVLGGDDSITGDPYLVSLGPSAIFYNGASGAGGAVGASWTPDTEWHDLVISRSDATVSFYLDGILLSNETLGNNNNATFKWIGTRNGTSDFYKGNTELVDLFNRGLTSDEVKLLYENALYKEPSFENTVLNIDTRLGIIYDKAGNEITKPDVQVLKVGAVSGVLFPFGTNARLDAGNSSILQLNNNISYIFWFNIGTLTSPSPYICYLGEESIGKRRIIFLTSSGIINFNSFGDGNTISSNNGYADKIWHCGVVTVQKSNKEVFIYVDGDLDNSGNLNDLNDYDITVNGFLIGNNSPPFNLEFEGIISIFQLSSHLLNSKEVSNYYNATKNYFNK